MTAKLTLFVVCCSSAFAQMDSTTLGAKYGEPIARETFRVRPNIEAVVDYGPGHQVCKIQLPPGSYDKWGGKPPLDFVSKQQMDEVMDELVPPSVRGKEIGHNLMIVGGFSMYSVQYEHAILVEPQDPHHPGQRTSVTITFKRPDCR